MNRALVTGYGIICGIGDNADECLDSIRHRRSSIGKMEILSSALSSKYKVAEVKRQNDELYRMTGYPNDGLLSRTALLGLIAAHEAVSMSGLSHAELSEAHLVAATTTAGIDLSDLYYDDLANGDSTHKGVIPSLDCSDLATRIATSVGISQGITTISTACSSSANAIMLGARLIKHGMAKRVLVGGSDALTRFSVNGFNALEILSAGGCKPFDQRRDGITPGEGAAFLMLESDECTKGRTIYGEITGYANINEAFHQTSTSPDGEGVAALINKALNVARLMPSQIDYINAHGTGTQANDLSEAKAIEKIFGNDYPAFSSTKGYTGHTFAAAGAIEAIFSLFSINNGLIIPNIGLEEKMADVYPTPSTELRSESVCNVLSNSLGFGGCNTSIIISKV